MTQSPIKTYAGMGCSATEFYISDDNVQIIENNRIIPFSEISDINIQILNNEIESDQAVQIELLKMHPNPEDNFIRLEQFVRCRFGGLDYQADIKDGILQQGEYWECPKRGNCQSEGILCKLPSYNGKPLELNEIKLLQLTATNKTNEVIAEDLDLPLGSFHKIKKTIYKKLGIQTKQEAVVISFFLNLIQFNN